MSSFGLNGIITHAEEKTYHGSLADDEYCHVTMDAEGLGPTYCGYVATRPPHGPYYQGEAICPGCGCPTCPRCAQLAALENMLEKGAS